MPAIQTATVATAAPPVSPLMLADRLITLAQEAERAGYRSSASLLVGMAYAVFEETPKRH